MEFTAKNGAFRRHLLIPALVFLLGIFLNTLNAQNRVPNPSFEEYLDCPFSTADFQYQVIDWYSWHESPDFFHVCSNELEAIAGVPQNAWGYQFPISGQAYAGLYTYAHHFTDGREYIATPLIQPLVTGEEYYVFVHASQYDGGVEIDSWCATSNIGIRFFKDPTYYIGVGGTPLSPDNFAHINYSEVLMDTLNWTLIDGWVTADDDYNWVAIGNFFDDSQTEIIELNDENRCFGIYYIENVCVATSPEECEYLLQSDSTSSVNEVNTLGLQVFPNPVQDELNITNSIGFIENVRVYDPVGKLLISRSDLSQSVSIQTTHWSKGLYVVLVEDENGDQKPFKVVKQ